MSRFAETRRESLSLQATGVLYVLGLAALVWLSIAIYSKTFTSDVTVVLNAEQAGQQLNVGGDVRMNGAIVGRVSKVEAVPSGAAVSLQINRDAAQEIPTDVLGRILPTTLFGQKFVELASDQDPAGSHLVEGSVIREDTSAKAVEVAQVLDDLDPLLAAVRPEKLASTLSALSSGLDGRGKQLGELINDGGAYLEALNQSSPDLVADLKLLDKVTDLYAEAAPDLLATGENASVTAETLVERRADVDTFLGSVDEAATSADRLLTANHDALIESARLARPTLELLDEYSPEIRCVLDGFLAVAAQTEQQISGSLFRGQFTFGAQVPGYGAADRFTPGDVGTGPACRGLPNAPIPYPGVQLNDGYTHPAPNDLLPILLGPDLVNGSTP